MIGAIAGYIAGSVYEWNNIKTKNFPLFSKASYQLRFSCKFQSLALFRSAIPTLQISLGLMALRFIWGWLAFFNFY